MYIFSRIPLFVQTGILNHFESLLFSCSHFQSSHLHFIRTMLFFSWDYSITPIAVTQPILFVELFSCFQNDVIFTASIVRINFCKISLDVLRALSIVIKSVLIIMYFFLQVLYFILIIFSLIIVLSFNTLALFLSWSC